MGGLRFCGCHSDIFDQSRVLRVTSNTLSLANLLHLTAAIELRVFWCVLGVESCFHHSRTDFGLTGRATQFTSLELVDGYGARTRPMPYIGMCRGIRAKPKTERTFRNTSRQGKEVLETRETEVNPGPSLRSYVHSKLCFSQVLYRRIPQLKHATPEGKGLFLFVVFSEVSCPRGLEPHSIKIPKKLNHRDPEG